jgi:ribose transport system substrate-binding protein
MVRRRWWLTALMGVVVVGCGAPSGGDGQAELPAPTLPGRPRIALVMKSLANEFFVTMADGARKHHESHHSDYDLIVNGIGNESDITQQVALVEQMLSASVPSSSPRPTHGRSCRSSGRPSSRG